MEIVFNKAMLEAIGVKDLVQFGYSEDKTRWSSSYSIDMSNYTRTAAKTLLSVLEKHRAVRGMSGRIEDLTRWIEVLDGKETKCKKLSNFAPMLKQYLKDAPKHWVYLRRDHSETYQPYYVSEIHYTPPAKRDGWVTPGYVTMYVSWEELGVYNTSGVNFYKEDCEGFTPARALAEAGYLVESPEMLKEYEENKAKYIEIHDKIGLQFTAVGVAEEETERRSYWYYRNSLIQLERDGVPSRVVVDVLQESDEKKSSKDRPPSGDFWKVEGCDFEGSEDDDDKDIAPGDEDEITEAPLPEVPLAPSLMCFDLRRHCRLKIYVDQMSKYEYRTDLAEKLILPDEVTDLVNMLVGHKGGFQDIIGGKGGGSIILAAGLPGTGKTLTAEVYSEAMSRPLYSVQCSQLGVDPEGLEKELLKVFTRAARWNAILLLDEADVYVAARGRDLTQNAIVGVFLRTLEYYAGVLFMTTNRADLVDDAVASRCLARIDYTIPTQKNQERIWRTLADTAGIRLSGTEIKKIVDRFPTLSGRDVKNLLKLASMVASVRKVPITSDVIAFVSQFKPTSTQES